MADDGTWHCLGCGVALDMEYTDNWCHRCLDTLRGKLAALLSASPWNMSWGWSYGPSLEQLFHSDYHWWDRAR
jgi:hypothetical protein